MLFGEQTAQCRVQIVHVHPTLSRRMCIVPCFVREPLHVVRQIAGELDVRRSDARLWLDARSREARFDECGEYTGRNFFEPHHRSGFVKRTPGTEHALHQSRLRAGKHITDAALVLNSRS